MLSNAIDKKPIRNYQTECLAFRRFLLQRGHKVYLSNYTLLYKAKTLWFTPDGIIPLDKVNPNRHTTMILYSNPWKQYNDLINIDFYDFILDPNYHKSNPPIRL